jgi:hypothetical protein
LHSNFKQVVLRGNGFSFDGGFHTMTEPVFYTALPFGFYLAKERKTGRVIGLKNKWFLDGKGCKKDLS